MKKIISKTIQSLTNGLLAAALFLNSSTVALLPVIQKDLEALVIPTTKLTVVATAYSSHVEQTDDTPHITASNKMVFDGLLAANFLKFGTRVKIPDLFGDKIFTVEDRMNRRYNKADPPRIDVWFDSLVSAKKFGVKTLEIEIIN